MLQWLIIEGHNTRQASLDQPTKPGPFCDPKYAGTSQFDKKHETCDVENCDKVIVFV